MIDYRGLEALHTILDKQHFDLAAQNLNISQSAISQRLRSLEEYYGQALLLRTQPYKATAFAEVLLRHYRQVLSLESELQQSISQADVKAKVSIAVSRDMLETWFIKILCQSDFLSKQLIEVIADDQDLTHTYLKSGRVSACISTQKKAMSGCQAFPLGHFDYCMVAAPEFAQQYFSTNRHKENIKTAPALIFDANDDLHRRYTAKYFSFDETPPQHHLIPSVRGFKQFALQGFGYGLIPYVDILQDLQSGHLVELFPKKRWKMPVYWHGWQIESDLDKRFRALVMAYLEGAPLDCPNQFD